MILSTELSSETILHVAHSWDTIRKIPDFEEVAGERLFRRYETTTTKTTTMWCLKCGWREFEREKRETFCQSIDRTIYFVKNESADTFHSLTHSHLHTLLLLLELTLWILLPAMLCAMSCCVMTTAVTTTMTTTI
jgi:hypothetical protein